MNDGGREMELEFIVARGAILLYFLSINPIPILQLIIPSQQWYPTFIEVFTIIAMIKTILNQSLLY